MDKPMTTYIEKKNTTLTYSNILDKEIIRKGIYCLIAFIPFIAAKSITFAVALLLTGSIIYLISEILRINGKENNLIAKMTLLAARTRDNEKIVMGPLTLAAGALISLLLFPPQAAKIAILALAFGDSIACIAGKKLSSFVIPYTRGKTFAGCIACFMTIYLIVFKLTLSMPIAFALASIGTLIEALPLKDLDNIVLPVGVGFFAYLIQIF